jgi:hypothetical protein
MLHLELSARSASRTALAGAKVAAGAVSAPPRGVPSPLKCYALERSRFGHTRSDLWAKIISRICCWDCIGDVTTTKNFDLSRSLLFAPRGVTTTTKAAAPSRRRCSLLCIVPLFRDAQARLHRSRQRRHHKLADAQCASTLREIANKGVGKSGLLEKEIKL